MGDEPTTPGRDRRRLRTRGAAPTLTEVGRLRERLAKSAKAGRRDPEEERSYAKVRRSQIHPWSAASPALQSPPAARICSRAEAREQRARKLVALL